MADPQTPPPQMRVQWISDPSRVPSPVNQFILQGGPGVGSSSRPDTFVVTLGNLNPPIVPNNLTEQEIIDFASNNFAISVELGKFIFTPPRLRELHDMIGTALKVWDETSVSD